MPTLTAPSCASAIKLTALAAELCTQDPKNIINIGLAVPCGSGRRPGFVVARIDDSSQLGYIYNDEPEVFGKLLTYWRDGRRTLTKASALKVVGYVD